MLKNVNHIFSHFVSTPNGTLKNKKGFGGEGGFISYFFDISGEYLRGLCSATTVASGDRKERWLVRMWDTNELLSQQCAVIY